MAGTYTLKSHVTFAAAHQLRGYQGNCARLHGHNYRAEVEVRATKLDEIGFVLDVRDLRKAIQEVAAGLDHEFINEIEPFDRVNPTAENLARYFFDKVAEILNDPRVKVSAVTMWETERCSVRYESED